MAATRAIQLNSVTGALVYPAAVVARAAIGAVGLTGNETIVGDKTFSGTVVFDETSYFNDLASFTSGVDVTQRLNLGSYLDFTSAFGAIYRTLGISSGPAVASAGNVQVALIAGAGGFLASVGADTFSKYSLKWGVSGNAPQLCFFGTTLVSQPSAVTPTAALVALGLLVSPAATAVSEGGTGSGTAAGARTNLAALGGTLGATANAIAIRGADASTVAASAATVDPATGATTVNVTGSALTFIVNRSDAGTAQIRVANTSSGDIVDTGVSSGRAYVIANATATFLDLYIAGTKGATVSTSGVAVVPDVQNAKVGGVIFNHSTDTSTTSTNGTEDDLYSNTLVASTLGADNQSVTQIEHAQFVSSATATRRLKKYFSGTLIFDSGALTLSLGGDFILETTIIRESSTVVRCSVSVVTTSASSVPYATYTRITGLTLSATNILKTTGIAAGVGAASGDIKDNEEKTYWYPAA